VTTNHRTETARMVHEAETTFRSGPAPALAYDPQEEL
jgi:hypothetical protein